MSKCTFELCLNNISPKHTISVPSEILRNVKTFRLSAIETQSVLHVQFLGHLI